MNSERLSQTLEVQGDLQLGETVPALEAKTLDGKAVSFPYGASELPVVIYVLSPTCKWCEKNQRSVELLAYNIKDKHRFIALALMSNDLKQYLEEKTVSFPVSRSFRIYSSYKLGSGTPQTIVVSSEGSVLKNWHGAYSGTVKDEVEAYFSIHLPTIAPP